MKAVFVFAVLALCAFAAVKRPVIPKIEIPKATRDDKTFTPAELGCEYAVKYKTDVVLGSSSDSDSEFPIHDLTVKGYIYGAGIYHGYTTESKMTYMGMTVEIKMNNFIRPDIKNEDDEIALVTLTKTEAEGQANKECEYEYVDKDTDPTSEFVAALSDTYPYTEKKDDQEWEGMKCTMYYYNDEYNFCVDENDHIIGINEGGNTFTFYKYKTDVAASDFVGSVEYVGCEETEEVYKDPEDDPKCPFTGSSESSDSSETSGTSGTSETSESSSASTVKACAALVLAVLVLLF